jgi:hypothetical protein
MGVDDQKGRRFEAICTVLKPRAAANGIRALRASGGRAKAERSRLDRLRTGAARGGCAHGRPARRRCKVLTVDGWTAAGAYVPPPERRGLVLVDPPFEEMSDFIHLSEILAVAHRKWPTGSYLRWYPIKDREVSDALARRLRKLAVPDILRCELTMGAEVGGGLVGRLSQQQTN